MVVRAGQRQAAPRFDRNGLVVINNVSIVDSLSVSSVEYILCSLVPNEISNLDEPLFGKDISMIGQTGPALIEYLSHRLRREVIRLVSDDLQYISLPVLEWRVLYEEREHVALRMLGEAALHPLLLLDLLPLLRLDVLGRVDEGLHVALRAEPADPAARLVVELVELRVALAHDVRAHRIDQILERQAGIDIVLDGVL